MSFPAVNPRKALVALLAVAAALGAALAGRPAPPALAQSQLPAPGCAGQQVDDPPGDTDAAAGSADNLDIVGGWFLTDSRGITANIRVVDMSTDPPPPATAATWYMRYTVGRATHFVSATADVAGDVSYDYGIYSEDETGASYLPGGATKGTVAEGRDGGVSIVIPKQAKGEVGQKLTKPQADSYQLVQHGLGGGILLFGDTTDAGGDYTVGGCELAPPNPGTPGTPPGIQPAPKLPVRLVSKSARPRGRTVSLRLRASDRVTRLAARLRRGKRTVATGRLARVRKGTAILRLRTRGRVAKGRHTLDLTGVLADGRRGSRSFALRIR